MTPDIINRLLASGIFQIFARALLTLMFWLSGFAKLFDFNTALAEMERYGLSPAGPIALSVIFVQLVGSALVISGRYVWLGAGALGVFTVLTIPIAHAFWSMTGEAAFMELMFAIEHLSVIGGLVVVAILMRQPSSAKETGRFARA